MRPHSAAWLRIEAESWTITHAAERLGVTRAFLSRILRGHAGITAATALRLEAFCWSDAEHWIRMQASHNLARERRRASPSPDPSPRTTSPPRKSHLTG